MKIEEEITRGARADQLLNDPLLAEAFDLVAKAIHEKWENAPISDHAGAHELKLMLKLLADVRANLEMAVHDGHIAQDKLRHLNRKPTPAEWRASLAS